MLHTEKFRVSSLASLVNIPSQYDIVQCAVIGCKLKQEISAKLTNQRVSYAFSSSQLSFHARHVLPTSKFQHSYSCILLIFYTTDISEQHV